MFLLHCKKSLHSCGFSPLNVKPTEWNAYFYCRRAGWRLEELSVNVFEAVSLIFAVASKADLSDTQVEGS